MPKGDVYEKLFCRRYKKVDEWIKIVSNLGFPIVVSLLLLLRIEHRLENLTKAIQELSQAIISFKG